MKASLIGRVDTLQAKIAPRADFDALADEATRWCERVLGVAFDDLDYDDLDRVMQLLDEAPDCAHPLVLRACLARPEDREPRGPRPRDDATDPEWLGYITWQRRRWGYQTAANDPEVMELAQRIEAWAMSADRAYLRGADLRLVFARLGILPWGEPRYFDLRRLADLCAVLDELATWEPDLEVPAAAWWSVLGWHEHHARRSMRAA
jgi:hypothetical protein